jgi:hypothetical protein
MVDEYQMSDDGKSLIVLYDGCVQRVSLPDGKVLSEAAPQSGMDELWPSAWFATKYLISGDTIFYSDDSTNEPVNQINIQQGKAGTLIQDSKYSLIPVLTIGDVLIVEATPGYDSQQREYWGVNTQTGERLWQYALKGQGRISYNAVQRTSSGFFMIQCREDPDGCAWTKIDPKTGVGSNSGSGLGGAFIDPTWDKDTLYLIADGELQVINITNGSVSYQWP